MAGNTVEFILRARDQASRVIRGVSEQVSGLNRVTGLVGFGATGFGLVAGAAAIAGAAALGMGKQLADTVERLDRVSGATGATVQQLQVLERTYKNAGLAGEDAGQTLIFLNRAIGRQDPLLRQLGISTHSAYEALLQLGDIFAQSDDAAKKQAISLKLAGRSSAELVGIMGTLRAAVGATGEEMRKAGTLIDEETAAKARKLDAQLDHLATTWEGTWTRIVAMFAPIATVIVDDLSEILDELQKLIDLPPIRISIEILRVAFDFKGWRERIADFARDAGKSFAAVEDAIRAAASAGNNSAIAGAFTLRAAFVPPPPPDKFIGPPVPPGLVVPTPPKRDSLAGIDLSAEKAPKESARSRRLEEIMRLLGLTRAEAERTLQALEKIEDLEARQQLLEKLGAIKVGQAGGGPVIGGEAPGVFAPGTEDARAGEEHLSQLTRAWKEWQAVLNDTRSLERADAASETLRKRLEDLGEVTPEVTERIRKALQDLDNRLARFDVAGAVKRISTDLDQIASPVAALNGIVTGSFRNLTGVFEDTIRRIGDKSLKLKNVLTDAWRAIKDSVISAIAEIAAALVTKLLILPFVAALLGPFGAAGFAFGAGASAGSGGKFGARQAAPDEGGETQGAAPGPRRQARPASALPTSTSTPAPLVRQLGRLTTAIAAPAPSRIDPRTQRTVTAFARLVEPSPLAPRSSRAATSASADTTGPAIRRLLEDLGGAVADAISGLQPAAAAAGGQHIEQLHLHTYDARDTLLEFLSPRGTFRRALAKARVRTTY